MAQEEQTKGQKKWHQQSSVGLGGFYFLTALGVAVYYIQQADGFWASVLGIIKAIIWPAFLIHKVFTLLGM